MSHQPGTVVVQAPKDKKGGDDAEIMVNGFKIKLQIPQGVDYGGQFAILDPALSKGGGQPGPQNGGGDVPMATPIPDMSRNAGMGGPTSMVAYNGQQMQMQPGMVTMPQPLVLPADFGAILMQFPALRFEQAIESIDLCGYDAKEQYRIFGADPLTGRINSPQIMHMTEKSDCFERQCCHHYRSADLLIRLGDNKFGPSVAVIKKDFHLNFCFGLIMPPHATMLDPNTGGVMAIVDNPWGLCTLESHIKDPAGQLKYRVSGTLLQSGACCPCDEMAMNIHDMQGSPVGKIAKPAENCETCFLSRNRFYIVFPQNANSLERAGLIAGLMMMNFEFFEAKNNNNDNNSYFAM